METEHGIYIGCELRAEDGDNGPALRGYAAVYDSLSEDLGGFREKLQRGVFKRSLQEQHDVRALVEHDPARIIGRSKSGTLTMRSDNKGLNVNIDLPDTQQGRDLHTLVKRGDLSQMSFGFFTRTDSWETKDEEQIRTLVDVDLVDVSVVAYPAYRDTVVAERNLKLRSWKKAQDELASRTATLRGHREKRTSLLRRRLDTYQR